MRYWRPEDGPGRRLFLESGPFECEAGGWLPAVTVAYETWGPREAPAVLVLHALTGDSHAVAPDGWWAGLVGPGLAIDTTRFFVVCSNVLGGCQGTTGPSSPD